MPIRFFPNCIRKSNYQNSVKLLALVSGTIHTVRLGAHTCSLNIRGDSETVLHWSLTDKFRSTIAIPVIILFIAICDHFKIHIQSGIHISGKDNFIRETLSRLLTSDSCLYGRCGSNGQYIPSIKGLMLEAISLISICQELTTENQFLNLFCARFEDSSKPL